MRGSSPTAISRPRSSRRSASSRRASILEAILGLAVALALHRVLAGARLFRAIVALPLMVAPVVGALAWRFMFADGYGLIDTVATHLGLDGPLWFADIWLARDDDRGRQSLAGAALRHPGPACRADRAAERSDRGGASRRRLAVADAVAGHAAAAPARDRHHLRRPPRRRIPDFRRRLHPDRERPGQRDRRALHLHLPAACSRPSISPAARPRRSCSSSSPRSPRSPPCCCSAGADGTKGRSVMASRAVGGSPSHTRLGAVAAYALLVAVCVLFVVPIYLDLRHLVETVVRDSREPDDAAPAPADACSLRSGALRRLPELPHEQPDRSRRSDRPRPAPVGAGGLRICQVLLPRRQFSPLLHPAYARLPADRAGASLLPPVPHASV